MSDEVVHDVSEAPNADAQPARWYGRSGEGRIFAASVATTFSFAAAVALALHYTFRDYLIGLWP